MTATKIGKILVPLDGTPEAETALPVADRLAQDLGAELVLLTVGVLPETSMQADTQRAELHSDLADSAAMLNSPSRRKVRGAGDPVRGILEAAEEEQADLIVMYTPERSKLEELAQGNIAKQLQEQGRFPVMQVPPRSRR